jgi:hypothetical protein
MIEREREGEREGEGESEEDGSQPDELPGVQTCTILFLLIAFNGPFSPLNCSRLLHVRIQYIQSMGNDVQKRRKRRKDSKS